MGEKEIGRTFNDKCEKVAQLTQTDGTTNPAPYALLTYLLILAELDIYESKAFAKSRDPSKSVQRQISE